MKVVGSAIEKSLFQGFGKDFATVDFTTPDAAMLSRLTRDVWQFSAAKNYQQLRDTTLALIDESGKARNFADFKDAAKQINNKYNDTWLKTEYNQAVGSSTMAARWSEYKANADIMPFLQYDTAGDNNVRPEHQLLDGIIRKITDEFWKQYFPPNGWGCRCGANQLSTSTAVETQAIPTVKVPEMFKTNLADNGLIFPKGHAYYTGIPNKILRTAIQTLPDDVAYKAVYTNPETKGSIKMHLMHGTSEMASNIAMSETLADYGYKVKLLPIIDTDRDDIRKIIFKTDKFIPGKNPDALINKEIFEMKWLKKVSYKNLQRNTYKASKQANNVFLKITETLTEKQLSRPINGIFNQSKSIKQVWIDNNGDILKMQNPNYKK
ncbi:MAG: minor capsid protein [Bacteroidetes bacterium]|nr:minor capsid protein [Bacteroidota bacterium]